MKDFYTFATNNPVLTFGILALLTSAAVQIKQAIFGIQSESPLEIGDNEDDNRSKH